MQMTGQGHLCDVIRPRDRWRHKSKSTEDWKMKRIDI